jgi:transposase
MRIIGLDLALTGAHKAVIADERGQPLTPVLSLQTTASDLQQLLDRARERTTPAEDLVLVMEPTGMAWFPVAAFAVRQPQVTVYLVNSQQAEGGASASVADLRAYYQKHHKSDRIDARVLVKLPVISPEKLHPLCLPSADPLACQRGCKPRGPETRGVEGELDRLMTLHTAIQNRLSPGRPVSRKPWTALPGPESKRSCRALSAHSGSGFANTGMTPRRCARPAPRPCVRRGRPIGANPSRAPRRTTGRGN